MRAIWAENVHSAFSPLSWDVPEDLAFFKEQTMGGRVLMGRGTWDSLPVKPLPGRENVVLTSRPEAVLGAETVDNYFPSKVDPTWVIGGARLISELMPFITEAHVTQVDVSIDDPETLAPFTHPWLHCMHVGDWLISRTGTKYRHLFYVKEKQHD